MEIEHDGAGWMWWSKSKVWAVRCWLACGMECVSVYSMKTIFVSDALARQWSIKPNVGQSDGFYVFVCVWMCIQLIWLWQSHDNLLSEPRQQNWKYKQCHAVCFRAWLEVEKGDFAQSHAPNALWVKPTKSKNKNYKYING